MKRKRHTTEEIIRKLREADQMAATGEEMLRDLGCGWGRSSAAARRQSGG